MLTVLTGHSDQAMLYTLERLLLHIGYLNGFTTYPWVNAVYWSLAIELQFYSLHGYDISTATGQQWIGVATLLAFLAAAFVIAQRALPLSLREPVLDGDSYLLGNYSWLPSLGYLLSLLAIGLMGVLTMDAENALAGVCASLFIRFVKLPSLPKISFFGALSYSIYLLHIPVWKKVNQYITLPTTIGDQLLALAIGSAATLLSAYLLNRLVERPSQRLSARLSYQNRREVKA